MPHIPVLLDEVLQYLDPKEGDSYLDLTAGYGGHAAAILAKTGERSPATLVDRDQQAIDVLKAKFARQVAEGTVSLRRQDFLSASRELLGEGRKFELILADLGVSSPHLNVGPRGFAINLSGPLDMRMDQSQGLSAETIVNSYSEADLADLLRRYGEEPRSKRIAKLIVSSRPITGTNELAAVVARAWPKKSRVHPATRTFQALRIAVNDELRQLEQSLPLWMQLLVPGGRLAVISFHSLEDRLVKQALQDAAGERYDAELRLLNKRPIQPGPDEIVSNPRARSAKLRSAVKIKRKGTADANSGQKQLPRLQDPS